jgi:hypothetical protein
MMAIAGKSRTCPSVVAMPQDECRSRSACEAVLSNVMAHTHSENDDTFVLLYCRHPESPTPTTAARGYASWRRYHALKLLTIIFDYARALCECRIDRCLGHPKKNRPCGWR